MGERLIQKYTKGDSSKLLRYGTVVTVIWILVALGFLYLRTCLSAPYNEIDKIGGFLQGVFAPLAFLWLVIATFLQRKELEQNREALMLQAKELENSVEQLTRQTEIFSQERQDARRTELEDKIARQLDLLAKYCLTNLDQTYWVAFPPNAHHSPHRVGLLDHVGDLSKFREASRPDETFRLLKGQLENFVRQTQASYDSTYTIQRSNNLDHFNEAIRRSDEILMLAAQVPGSTAETHVRNVGLENIRNQLRIVLDRLANAKAS